MRQYIFLMGGNFGIEKILFNTMLVSCSQMGGAMEDISKLLAVLVAENESYTYVDKLGYAPSKDLVLYYLREALRDFHSLKNKPQWDHRKAFEKAKEIDMESVEREIQRIERISSMKELREAVSLITAKALSIASTLMEEERPGASGAPSSGS